MQLFLRLSLAWVLVILGPLSWLAQNGLTQSPSILPETMTADGPLAVGSPLPIPPYFSDVSDNNKNPSISDLRLFEDGKELGPAHTMVTTIKSAGRGVFSHWGHQIYFSASDGTSPKTNGRTYVARFSVYPVLEVYQTGVLAPIALFAGLCAIIKFLALLRRARAGESAWIRQASLGAGIILLLTVGVVALLRVTGQTAYWTFQKAAIERHRGFAYSTPMPTSRLFAAMGDSVRNGATSDLRLFEDGKEIGPRHQLEDDIVSRGKGGFVHWGNALYFSSTDGSPPLTSRHSYRAEYTQYLKAPFVWSVVALCGLGMAFLAWSRLETRPLVDALKDWSRRLSMIQGPPLGLALARLAGLTLVYSLVLILIGASLTVQRSSVGELKINFEYKVF
jgi:hypothetical protein